MEERQSGDQVEVLGAAKFTAWVQGLLMVVFAGLAAGARWASLQGYTLGRISDQTTVMTFLYVVFLSVAAYEFVSLAINLAIRRRGGSPGEVTMLTGFARVVLALVLIFALIHSTGKLVQVGTVVGAFAGMLFGWSLQAPVSGVAAWALITLKRPFRVGDRVLFPSLNLLGDVLEVGLMYTRLNQVGGTVATEEASGRHILIPNAMLFSQVAINYAPQLRTPHILDEVVIRVTFDSDWQTAENVLLDAARSVTGDIIRTTGKEPYIRCDWYDYGVYMRLRYMTLAKERPRLSYEIQKRIFNAVQRTPHVDLAIPYVYSFRKGSEGGKPLMANPDDGPAAAPCA